MNEGFGLSFGALLLLLAAGYVYFAFILFALARKTGTPDGWRAWVPILNLILMCRIGRQPPLLALLLLVPVANLVALVLVWMGIARVRGKSAVLGVLMLVPLLNLVIPLLLLTGPSTGIATPSAIPQPPPAPQLCPACGRAECVGEAFCGYTGQPISPASAPAMVPPGADTPPPALSRPVTLGKAVLVALLVVGVGFIGVGLLSSGRRLLSGGKQSDGFSVDGVSRSGPPMSAATRATLITGGTSPNNIGCIYCDGQFRYLGPGFNHFSVSNRSVVAVPFPAGTISNLEVQFGGSGNPCCGNWGIFVEVTGGAPPPSGGLGCGINQTTNPGQRSCAANSVITIGDGALVTVTIGKAGDFFSAGDFPMTYSFQFTPNAGAAGEQTSAQDLSGVWTASDGAQVRVTALGDSHYSFRYQYRDSTGEFTGALLGNRLNGRFVSRDRNGRVVSEGTQSLTVTAAGTLEGHWNAQDGRSGAWTLRRASER